MHAALHLEQKPPFTKTNGSPTISSCGLSTGSTLGSKDYMKLRVFLQKILCQRGSLFEAEPKLSVKCGPQSSKALKHMCSVVETNGTTAHILKVTRVFKCFAGLKPCRSPLYHVDFKAHFVITSLCCSWQGMN